MVVKREDSVDRLVRLMGNGREAQSGDLAAQENG